VVEQVYVEDGGLNELYNNGGTNHKIFDYVRPLHPMKFDLLS